MVGVVLLAGGVGVYHLSSLSWRYGNGNGKSERSMKRTTFA
jgi:hypothetical protein